MAEGQKYRCTACGAEFATQQRLDEHNREAHASSGSGGAQR
jgi:hypothetical protein